MNRNGKKAVVLLSCGLDSTTVLAITLQQGYIPFGLTFRYGQRHQVEVELAQRIARDLGVREHMLVDIDLRQLGGSALTSEVDVPKKHSVEEIGEEIPVTYVPARNTIFLSLALAYAETLGATDIFIGVNALDYSGYPDCRPEYIAAFESLANLATKAGVEGANPMTIHAPLIQLTKAQIIRRGLELGVDYAATTSCYDPAADGAACGRCDACLLRLRGFADNNVPDPAAYVSLD